MPQWAGSCWYYLRYLDPHNNDEPWSNEVEHQWAPVDLYVGGAEHAVLHLLYARFWHKVLFDLGRVSTKEPFKKLRHQGTVLAHAYRDAHGHYHGFDEVEHRGGSVHLQATGGELEVSIQKMSKGSLNGINPDDVVAQHGADALRLYEMFMGDFEQPKPWDPRAIEGMTRFLRRVSRLVEKLAEGDIASGDKHVRLRHKTIRKVTNDLEAMKFNTAIAALMEYLNEIMKGNATREDLVTLIKLLGPFAPHLADEAWEVLGEKGFVIQATWPQYVSSLAGDAEMRLAVQVNGKVRGTLTLARDVPEASVRAQALALPPVAKYVENRTVKTVLVVPGKIVSIVVE
jgi:leucyl-tRNA synthetase